MWDGIGTIRLVCCDLAALLRISNAIPLSMVTPLLRFLKRETDLERAGITGGAPYEMQKSHWVKSTHACHLHARHSSTNGATSKINSYRCLKNSTRYEVTIFIRDVKRRFRSFSSRRGDPSTGLIDPVSFF